MHADTADGFQQAARFTCRLDGIVDKWESRVAERRQLLPGDDHAVLVADRQRPQQHALNEGEEHRHTGNAESQRENRRCRERLGAPERSPGDDQVLAE